MEFSAGHFLNSKLHVTLTKEVCMSKVENTQENFNICMENCKPCLTYSDIEGEGLFCARGKSSAPRPKKGCNCGFCPVQHKSGCNGAYYCVDGPCE